MSRKKILLLLFLAVALILSVACRKEQRPPFLPSPIVDGVLDVPPPPEMGLRVRTDYSGLTAYVPPHTMHSRLQDGPLPQLIPSEDYGMLLPYASATVLPDGSLREAKYGLVTIDGVIVTDLVYDGIERATARPSAYTIETPAPMPAYKLAVNVPGTEILWGEFERKLAVCALDGSWITPFDYADIVFAGDIIILMHDFDTFDIDVYDYNGQFVYNVMQTDWFDNIRQNAWPGNMSYSLSEGYASLPARNGGSMIVEMRTGKATYLDYAEIMPFSGGLAAVIAPVLVRDGDAEYYTDLWGFIDRDFNLVIPHRYSQQAYFTNGYAVVTMPDNSQQVINSRGSVVFSVTKDFWIEQDYRGDGFDLYRLGAYSYAPVFYTKDFVEIKIPEIARSDEDYTYLNRFGGGWYSCRTDNGTVLFTLEEEFYFPGMEYISSKHGDILVYSVNYEQVGAILVYQENDEQVSRMGVMTLDGRDIIPPEPGVMITAVTEGGTETEGGTLKSFVINTHGSFLYFGGKDPEYKQSKFRLIDVNGGEIISGFGVLTYDEAAGLYKVLGSDHFAWLDHEGNTIISIPHMSGTMD